MQEALTNVTKHAGPGVDTAISLWWEEGELHLSVTNDGPELVGCESPHPLSTGNGLLGLRERAAAVGGRLEAGRLAGNGFRVTATLPRADQRDVARGDRAELGREVVGTGRGLWKVSGGGEATTPDGKHES